MSHIISYLSRSSAVAVFLEVEVQLQDTPVERTLEPMAFRHLPLSVYNCKRDIFIWSTGMEADCQSVVRTVWLKVELWSSCLVGQVWIENVEFVALNHFGWRVLRVVVHLVVLIPFIPLLDAVEEAWFATDEELL